LVAGSLGLPELLAEVSTFAVSMRIVIALGRNARGDKPDAAIQLAHLRTAAEAIAPLTAHDDVLICHGNGPQVGMLSPENETDHALTRPYPLDDLVAQTQGMIGYWLVQALCNAGVKKPVLGLITQTLVDAADPAFAAPTKFVGPGYARDRAEELAGQRGWAVAVDNGRWRQTLSYKC
jgi:carbamate kinase